MKVDDPVYGRTTVSTPVLQELIQSDPVQRLQHINQAGPQHYFMDLPRVTRFQHSVGVMLLLRDHGAPLEEQIAGLLHDVPHTAFSHVADFVFSNEDHEYHEQFMEEIVYNSEIPAILDRHGLDLDYILEESNFPLLERDIPDLCGDRVDYFFRDLAVIGGGDAAPYLQQLDTHQDRFVFTDADVAEQAALDYIRMDEEHWARPKEVAVLELFARAIRRALDHGVLQESDLFGTDTEVYDTLQAADHQDLREPLETLQNGFQIELDPDTYDFRVSTKARYIDPLVVTDGETFRTSEQSERLQPRIDEHREHVKNGYPIKVVSG